MSQEFLEKLRNYLNERFKDELGSVRFKIRTKEPNVKWLVIPESYSFVSCGAVYEYEDGRVQIGSLTLDYSGNQVREVLVRLHSRELKKRKWEEVSAKIDRKKKEIFEDFKNRRNIEKHLKKPYKHAFTRLLWADKIAEDISRRFGVEVKVAIDGESRHWTTSFASSFDSKDMNEERKFEEIKKRVEAVSAARKLYDEGLKKEYKEFHRKMLSKIES